MVLEKYLAITLRLLNKPIRAQLSKSLGAQQFVGEVAASDAASSHILFAVKGIVVRPSSGFMRSVGKS